MEETTNSWRSQLSFFVSVLLHAGAIALIALGPTMLSEHQASNPTKVEFTVSNATPAATPAAPTVAPIPAAPPAPPVAEPVQPIVEKPIEKPIAKPVAVAKPAPIKKVAVHKAAVKPVAQKLPAKVEAEPVVEAQNSDVAVDQSKEEPKEETKVDEKPAEDTAKEETAVAQTTEETTQVQAEPKQEEQKPDPVAKEKSEAKPETTVPPVATTQPAPAPEPTALAPAPQAEAPKAAPIAGGGGGPQATQNYLGLRQQPGNQPPSYTRSMRLKQLQGDGQLVYFVNKDGSVSDVRVTQSTGHPELDQAAVDAFSKYRFVPGQEGYTVHNFQFSLKGPAVSDTSRLRTAVQ